jgi:hypothetical protein
MRTPRSKLKSTSTIDAINNKDNYNLSVVSCSEDIDNNKIKINIENAVEGLPF